MRKEIITQAFAHMKQLKALGATTEQALKDTVAAYELTQEAANMLKGMQDMNDIHKELGIELAY